MLRLLLWTAAIVAAAVLGGPLALFGLGGVALVAALGLVALGALGWRRAALPLSLTAAALAISATAIATQPARVQRTHGLLIATPRAPADVVGTEYRRGHGSVVVDLRHFSASAGSTTTIRARSDDGGVVVALPRGRCYRLSVTYGRAPLPTDGIRGLALAGVVAARVVHDNAGGIDFGGNYRAPDYTGDSGISGNLVAFGRTFSAPSNPDAPNARFSWIRPTSDPTVPTLNLRLVANGMIVVRDYPADVSPAFARWDAGQPEATGDGTDVGDQYWPDGLRLPPSPGDLSLYDRWREHPTGAHVRRQRVVWQRWLRRFVPAAKAQAQRAAGTCASRATRADYWSTMYYNDTDSQITRSIAVNGNGVVRTYRQNANTGSTVLGQPGADPFVTPARARSASEATR